MPSLWATDAWSGCCRGWGATGTSSTCHTTERTPHTSISSRDKDTAQSAPTQGPPPTPSTGACITCGTRHSAFSSMGLRSLPPPRRWTRARRPRGSRAGCTPSEGHPACCRISDGEERAFPRAQHSCPLCPGQMAWYSYSWGANSAHWAVHSLHPRPKHRDTQMWIVTGSSEGTARKTDTPRAEPWKNVGQARCRGFPQAL